MPVDLSTLKGMPEENREPIEVEAAFMVIIREGNIVQASPDINAPIVPAREVSTDEMQMACQKVADDIQASKIAGVVQMQMMQMGAAMQQQAQSQRLMEGLNL